MKRKNLVLVSGGFDPLHSGHISLFKEAAKLGDELIIGLNSDSWLKRKKGTYLLPLIERKIIIENLKMVNRVLVWDDSDNTANYAIYEILNNMNENEFLIFANGGDRNLETTPELKEFENHNRVKFIFEVGGGVKLNSSSKILDDYKKNTLSK